MKTATTKHRQEMNERQEWVEKTLQKTAADVIEASWTTPRKSKDATAEVPVDTYMKLYRFIKRQNEKLLNEDLDLDLWGYEVDEMTDAIKKKRGQTIGILKTMIVEHGDTIKPFVIDMLENWEAIGAFLEAFAVVTVPEYFHFGVYHRFRKAIGLYLKLDRGDYEECHKAEWRDLHDDAHWEDFPDYYYQKMGVPVDGLQKKPKKSRRGVSGERGVQTGKTWTGKVHRISADGEEY